MSSGTGRTVAIIAIGVAFGGIAGAVMGAAMAGTAFGSILVGAAYMGGSFVGQMIFPADNPRDMPSPPDYPMQTVDRGSPVKLTYGTLRIAGNLVWMGPLSHYHVSGGKGGGDDGPKNYRRSFLIVLCEGPRSVLRMWRGKTEIDLLTGTDNKTGSIGAIFTGSAHEVTVFPGDGVNEGLAALIGEDYSDYRNDCCVLFKNYDLGPQQAIPAFTFEVSDYRPTDIWVHTGRGYAKYDTDEEQVGFFSGTTKGTTGANQVDIDASGNIVFTSGATHVYYETTDGTQKDLKPYDGAKGWIPTDDQADFGSGTPNGCRFSKTGDFAYVAVDASKNDLSIWMYVYKINVATGDIAWTYSRYLSSTGATMAVSRVDRDSGDNVYVGWKDHDGGSISVVKINGSNGHYVKDYVFAANGQLNDVWVDEKFVGFDSLTGEVHTGFLFICGFTGLPLPYYYVSWRNLDDGTIVGGAVYPARVPGFGWDRGFTCVRTFNNVVAVSGTRMYGGIYGADRHAVQLYDSQGGFLAGWDPGDPDRDFGHADWATRCYGFGLNPGGQIAVSVKDVLADGETSQYGMIQLLSASDLTPISNFAAITGFNSASDNSAGDNVFAFLPRTVVDANPVDIIYDITTNRRAGAAMPSAYINSDAFATTWQYCQDNDLLISVEINSSRPLLDWIQWICSHFGGFPFWVGGQLYLGAWRAEDPEFHITRDHLVADETGVPVHIKKRLYSESANHIELGWQDREDIYGPAVAPFRDDVDLRLSGKRRKKQIALPGIKREELAVKMGWRYLIDSMYRFSIYTFQLGAKDMLLHVGKVGLISDGFKLTDQRIRITSISESKDGINLDVEAVDDVSDLYPDLSARQVQTTLREPEVLPTEDDLEDVTATVRESDETGELYLSVAPGGTYTDGYRIYVSWDDSTYEIADRGVIDALTGGEANSIGTSLTTLPAERVVIWRPDQSLTVDIGTLTDLKTDVTAATFFQNGSLAQIGDEIIGFKTAVETGTEGVWIISELIRGLFGTEPVAHAAGETFATLDTDTTMAFDSSDIGRTLYVKALTSYGNLSQSLADVEATQYVIQGLADRPLGANLVRLTSDVADGWDNSYSGDEITLHWGLPGGESGYNMGGYDGGGSWAWGDDELDLVPQNGVLWGAYIQDPLLQAVDLEFRHESGTLLGQRTLGVVSTTTVSKATDLGGNNPATIQVYPVRSRRAIRPEPISVDDGS